MSPEGMRPIAAARAWTPKRVGWGGGILIACIVALGGFDAMRGYRATIERTQSELQSQAHVIAEQTERSVQAIDVVLRHVAAEFKRGRFERLAPEELDGFLRELAVGLVQIDGLGVFDARGEPLGLSWPAPRRAPNMSQLDRFRVLRDDPGAGFMIFEAARSPADGKWVVPFGRRLEAPDGSFAGVVAARGRVEYFQRVYRDAYPEPGSRVALVHRNTTLLARHPPADEALGRGIPQVTALLEKAAKGDSFSRNASPLDGSDRFAVIRSVPEYGLAVVVTRDASAALQAWRAQTIGTAIRTLLLAAFAALLLWFLARQLRRLDEARASLQATQNRFALAVAGSDDGIWVHDYESGRAFNSHRAQELVGMPEGPEEMPLEDWLASLPRYLHPDDLTARKAAMDAHLAGHTPIYEVDVRHRHPDGSYRWVRIRGICVRGADGKPLRMAGSISDVDARRRAEEALRSSEEQYRAIFNSTTDALILRDGAGRIVDVNLAWLEMNGVSREQAMTDRDRIFAPPEMQPRIREMIRRSLAGEKIDYQLQVERKQGEIAQLDVHLVPVPYRGQTHSLSVARDITAQKRAEESLRTSEEQYRAIFNASADALALRDADARLVDVNPAFLRMTGFTREEVLADNRWVFALPEQQAVAREMHRRVIAGETVHYEMQTERRDGARINVELRAVPIRYRGRTHSLAMARDITDRKRAEAERARLEDRLLQAKKLEAIGTLAGGIAHDFNNILAAILGYGEMAQKSAPPGSALRRHLDAVVSAGMRAKSLVERILAFSRSGMGERTPISVQAVVAEALDLAAASLPAGVRLKRKLNAPEATVMGDATQIHQVVMNLCANAAQAIKGEGTVTVRLAVVDKRDGMAATSALASGRYVRLRVSDTGAGIAANVLERIFDPFFTTKGVGVGTGLGLSLVHGIVTDLGGGIDVDSQPGQGATFTIYLPLSDMPAASAAASQAAPTGEGQSILLVDDEEMLVRLGEEVIAALGYEPVGFASSSAALAAFRSDPSRFDAVLSDEAMPELTGSELAKAIRTLRPDIPIVLMSGVVSPALQARARDIGVAEVLSKPLVSADIARALSRVLNRVTT